MSKVVAAADGPIEIGDLVTPCENGLFRKAASPTDQVVGIAITPADLGGFVTIQVDGTVSAYVSPVTFDQLKNGQLKTMSIGGTFDRDFAGVPVMPGVSFQVLDIHSPVFAIFMVDKILERYNIPPCDEVQVRVIRNTASRVTTVGVKMFGYQHAFDVTDSLLVSERDPASVIASMIMQSAALCWQKVTE